MALQESEILHSLQGSKALRLKASESVGLKAGLDAASTSQLLQVKVPHASPEEDSELEDAIHGLGLGTCRPESVCGASRDSKQTLALARQSPSAVPKACSLRCLALLILEAWICMPAGSTSSSSKWRSPSAFGPGVDHWFCH